MTNSSIEDDDKKDIPVEYLASTYKEYIIGYDMHKYWMGTIILLGFWGELILSIQLGALCSHGQI